MNHHRSVVKCFSQSSESQSAKWHNAEFQRSESQSSWRFEQNFQRCFSGHAALQRWPQPVAVEGRGVAFEHSHFLKLWACHSTWPRRVNVTDGIQVAVC